MDELEERFSRYEKMHDAIIYEYEDICKKIEEYKLEGKVKTITFRQLTSRKMVYKDIIAMYEIFGIN
ncbi:MAG: hypothetical protein GX225_02205 [Clostridiales bacterium]|nr:hypothetical protein [Clostridiales bacterium]